MTERTVPVPLSADDFGGEMHNGVALVEDENAVYVMALGHVDLETFADAVLAYDVSMSGLGPEDFHPVSPTHVKHVWAITTTPPGDDWHVSWGGVTQTTPGAFAMTVLER